MKKLRNTYYILRHGQTIYQTKKKDWAYPKIDSSKVRLTKKGQSQIKHVAKKIARLGVDMIFSSDFFRTKQTSEIVAKELGINPALYSGKGGVKKVVFDKNLRDLNLGKYAGGKEEDYYKDFPRKSLIRFSKKPRGGESWNQCQRRIVGFMKRIDKKHSGKTILIVGHGDPLWLLEGWVKNWSQYKLLKEKYENYINNGELRKLA